MPSGDGHSAFGDTGANEMEERPRGLGYIDPFVRDPGGVDPQQFHSWGSAGQTDSQAIPRLRS